jgi:hypothetical protein
MKIQTNHKTFNKTIKREIVSLLPNAKCFKKFTLSYKPVYHIKDINGNTIATVNKSNDLFKGLVITIK